jgi:uncharacterized membrane protein YfcA
MLLVLKNFYILNLYMNSYFIISIIGIVAGVLTSIVGGGGYSILIPLLYHSGVINNYKTAIGTCLMALLPPLSIAAVYQYYKEGHVKVHYSIMLGLMIFIGSYIGSTFAVKTDIHILKYIFGIFLIIMGTVTLIDTRTIHQILV